MDGSLTGTGESDVEKQQLTARVPLNGCLRGSTPNFSAAMENCNMDAVKRPCCRRYHTLKTGRVVGLPIPKSYRAQHRTLLPAFQRCAAPRSMDGVHESYHTRGAPVRVQTAWHSCQPIWGGGGRQQRPCRRCEGSKPS
eukprot:1082767-Prymnesium_polylepis.1